MLDRLTAPAPDIPACDDRVPSFVARLAAGGDRPALITPDDREISYRELDRRVAAFASRLGGGRRLVAVDPVASEDGIVAYLGALRAGCVVLLSPPAARSGLAERYRPAAEWDAVTGLRDLGAVGVPDVHPDLCLLLPTSGTTGSPRLVRLSYGNVESNAAAISGALGLTADDRAALVLPLSYCYGLSVLHSHLEVHGSLVLGIGSVTEDADWDRITRHEVTNLAGVPYTFDLLDRSGFAARTVPSLRLLTQAGGRMPAEQVTRFARLGRERGFGLAVMYGQTEATARMAVLPPDEAAAHPGTIGYAVPGGRFGLAPLSSGEGAALMSLPAPEAVPPGEVGELCYSGPNVMMGYATSPEDLARGAETAVLRTGDLARRDPDGRLTIVGRRARFAKPFGIRIDLDGLEATLAATGFSAWCDGDDNGIRLMTEAGNGEAVRAFVTGRIGLPASRVSVAEVTDLPRLANGKPDRTSLRVRSGDETVEGDLSEALATVLGRVSVADEDTFVGLGGDSLSYVEACGVLERRMRRVPRDWPQRTVGELRRLAAADPPRRRRVAVETSVVLRAMAIFFIVANHADWIRLQGGAHLLLVIAGYNYARFTLAGEDGSRVRRHRVLLARIGIPVAAAALLVATRLRLPDDGVRVLLSQYVQPRPWRFWFGEALVHILVVCTLLVGWRRFRKFEQLRPLTTALCVFGVALSVAAVSALLWGRPPAPLGFEYRTEYVAWFFALGWLLARSGGVGLRLALSTFVVLVVPRFFDQPSRGVFVALGVLALTWTAAVPLPRAAARAVTTVAAASLAIYLVHYEDLYPYARGWSPWIVTLAGIGLGLGVHAAVRGAWRGALRLRRTPEGEPAALTVA